MQRLLSLVPVAEVIVAQAIGPGSVREQGDDAVLCRAFRSGVVQSWIAPAMRLGLMPVLIPLAKRAPRIFISSTSQRPPFFGPTKRSFSSLTSFAVARSIALNDMPRAGARSARVKSGQASNARRIFSGVFTRVSTVVSTGVFTRASTVVSTVADRGLICVGANKNVTPIPIRFHLQHRRRLARVQTGLHHALDATPPRLNLTTAEK